MSDSTHLKDIQLIKEMNMNAVRIPHFSPDERFLELADSLGLFVLNGLGWQDANDLDIDSKLKEELILKDQNHPSVIVGSYGNKGGWNLKNEDAFHNFDSQDRPVFYPSLDRKGIDTFDYPTYENKVECQDESENVFIPTEVVHSLYEDGVGLSDFWKKNSKNPRLAGVILGRFSDQALLRDDLGGKLKSEGLHDSDGVLGPFREKKSNFYTIKSIWSPIQLENFEPNLDFDGRVTVRNEYFFSELSNCRIEWVVEKLDSWNQIEILASGSVPLPEIAPNETASIKLDLPLTWREGDFLSIKAIGIHGEELYTWSKAIRKAYEGNSRYFSKQISTAKDLVSVRETTEEYQISVADKIYYFKKSNGLLEKVIVGRRTISLSQLAKIEGIVSHLTQKPRWKQLDDGSIQIESIYSTDPEKITWTVLPSGELKFEAGIFTGLETTMALQGIGFNYPEEKAAKATWIGNGPNHVWANSEEGVEFGIWEKSKQNTSTASDQHSYLEFKGFHSNFHALKLETEEGEIVIKNYDSTIYLGTFMTDYSPDSDEQLEPLLPKSDISFLFKIPTYSNKFHLESEMMEPLELQEKPKKLTDRKIVLLFDFK